MATEERVAELADAALRIVMRDGLSGVTFRSVATESGWSLGAVQKAFTTKQELLGAVVQRAQERVDTSAQLAPGMPDLRTWLVELMLRMLPLDEPRRAAVLVGAAYADRAGVDPALAASLSGRDSAVRGQLAALFARTRTTGEHQSRLSDGDLARSYLALATGLSTQLLYEPRPEPDLRREIHDVLTALLR